MTLQDLRTLLDYHYWARDRLLEALEPLSQEQYSRDLGNSFKSIRDTVVHIYAAEWIWYQRWQGESPPALLTSVQFPDLAAVRGAWAEQETRTRAFLDSLGDDGIGRMFEYKMFSGQTGTSAFNEMLPHVVNHASYHRGQVTTMLRQIGAAPPKMMDMIAFFRMRDQSATSSNRG
jgi:uncharacterized damage-inducible protein DinB